MRTRRSSKIKQKPPKKAPKPTRNHKLKPYIKDQKRKQTHKPDIDIKEQITKPDINNHKPTAKLPYKVPDVLFTEDGTMFFPCKHCCRAFAQKLDLKNHSQLCALVATGTPLDKSPDTSPKTDMNDKTEENKQELNNNKAPLHSFTPQSEPEVELESAIEQELDEHETQKDETPKEKSLTFNMIPDGINAYDLKAKAKIVKNLNEKLVYSPISLFVMENGDLVAKIQASNANGLINPLEITSRTVDGNNKVQIIIKNSQPDENNDPIPELNEIFEKLFGIDPTFDMFAFKKEQASETNSVVIDMVEDEHEPEHEIDVDIKGTIVLEDLDIHICKQCGAVYHTFEDLVDHDKYEHRNFKKKYSQSELEKYTIVFKSADNSDNVCPICMKKLRGKSSWPRHMQSHSKVGLFECKICKKKFTRDDHRKNHESRHLYKYYDSE